MICPKCKELGLKSTLYPGSGFTTAMYCQPYYDEDGKYHHHDGNNSCYSYSCSNGHSMSVTAAKSCPSCDWGYPEKIEVRESPKSNVLVANGTGPINFTKMTTGE